jgi:hypothetical protein
MWFVSGEIHGADQNVRYKNYAMAVSVAKRLRNGLVKDEAGVVIFPKIAKTTPRWIQNPRRWNEDVRIVKTLPGINNEDDYRLAKRANYLTFADLLLDVASAVWIEHNGQIPANYWIRHKINADGYRDVNDNRLDNLEMTLARNYYDHHLERNEMPRGLKDLSMNKLREWFHYDEDTGVLFSRIPYLSIYGVRDETNKRPVAREGRSGTLYDIATACYRFLTGPVPPLWYVGFADLNPNNLCIDNLVLFPCDYGEEALRRDYGAIEDKVTLKSLGLEVMTWPLSVPGDKLSKTTVLRILTV